MESRRHGNVIESGLSFMDVASATLKFWLDAFTCYLINGIPSSYTIPSTLQVSFQHRHIMKILEFRMFVFPSFKILHFQQTWFNVTSFHIISLAIVYIKSYHCLYFLADPEYISRHIRFEESYFSLTESHTTQFRSCSSQLHPYHFLLYFGLVYISPLISQTNKLISPQYPSYKLTPLLIQIHKTKIIYF